MSARRRLVYEFLLGCLLGSPLGFGAGVLTRAYPLVDACLVCVAVGYLLGRTRPWHRARERPLRTRRRALVHEFEELADRLREEAAQPIRVLTAEEQVVRAAARRSEP